MNNLKILHLVPSLDKEARKAGQKVKCAVIEYIKNNPNDYKMLDSLYIYLENLDNINTLSQWRQCCKYTSYQDKFYANVWLNCPPTEEFKIFISPIYDWCGMNNITLE